MTKAPRFPFPIASYAIILLVSILHLYEALVISFDRAADGSIPIHALLSAISARYWLAAVMLGATIPAIYALWKEEHPPWLTMLLIVPQLFLMLVTAKGAYVAWWSGAYADEVYRSHSFIGVDQFYRAFAPLLYLCAVYQVLRERASNAELEKTDIENGRSVGCWE
jgi:hypothetical protein